MTKRTEKWEAKEICYLQEKWPFNKRSGNCKIRKFCFCSLHNNTWFRQKWSLEANNEETADKNMNVYIVSNTSSKYIINSKRNKEEL